jgi:hypothetical protein
MIENVTNLDWRERKNSPLLLLPFMPGELNSRFGVKFTMGSDDLGQLELAAVRVPALGVVGLIRYEDAKFEGTTVYVDMNVNLRSARDAVLRAFGVDESEVLWVASTLLPE